MNTPQPGISGADLLWFFGGVSGRITRLPFWLGIIFVNVIAGIFIGTMMRNPAAIAPIAGIVPFIMLAALWAEIALVVKRAHDCNVTGFVALMSLLPFVNIVLVVFFGIMQGDPNPNAYGREQNVPPPRRDPGTPN